MNGSDLLVQYLRHCGIEFITTVCGNGLDPLYVACRKAGVRLVDFHNEQAASLAADTVARLTGKLAVCAVSSGGAHVNALVGLTNAYYDGAPLLLITGASESARTGMGKFQDLDQVALAAPVCRYAGLVDSPERLGFHLHEACALATSGRGGPAHLTIPRDVLSAEVEPALSQRTPTHSKKERAPSVPAHEIVAEAVDLFHRSERPVLVAGSGAFYAGAGHALEEFVKATDIPVMVPIWDRGVVSHADKHFLGVVGADSGGPRILPDADLIVMVGARIDYRVGYAEPPAVQSNARLIRIEIDAHEIRQGRDPDVAMLANPSLALMALKDALIQSGFAPRKEWMTESKRREIEFKDRWAGPVPPAPPMTGRHIIEALSPHLADEVTFLIDGGNIGQWAHILADKYPEHWLTCGPSGLVGWGIAGAIGAKVAYPERPVILLSGDGSIGFGLIELETAVRHNTPFVAVLADDQAWGIVVSGQQRTYGPEGDMASRLGPIEYDRAAEALGAGSVRVASPEQIGPAIIQGLASGRPTLVHVPVIVQGPMD